MKYDIVIIGGGPSGIIIGATAKKQNPDKRILMLKEEENGLVPCGIPYIFHDLGSVDKNKMGPKAFIDLGGDVKVDRAAEIGLDTKTVTTESGATYTWEKLVFATGSQPFIPHFIPGYELDGVEYITKSYNCISELKEKTDKASNIIVVGGGFIGVETGEQLARHTDKNVTLIEMEKYCLSKAFSSDFAERADAVIRETGMTLYTGTKVLEILGENGKVNAVKLSDGNTIPADIVIMAIGYKPNTEIAAAAGLEINKHGAIVVDNYLRTSADDVFAVGDCASKVGFITGRTDNIMLASTATAEARVLGYNLFKIQLKRNFNGTISVFSTEINEVVFASAGAIEESAAEANIDFVVGSFEDVDHHPGTLPGTKRLGVKLIVSPGDGSIIGGEICGGKSAGELINVIGLAIQKGVTVYELVSFQIGTHPLLTTAPTKYVLIKAAENALNKI